MIYAIDMYMYIAVFILYIIRYADAEQTLCIW